MKVFTTETGPLYVKGVTDTKVGQRLNRLGRYNRWSGFWQVPREHVAEVKELYKQHEGREPEGVWAR
jgi:hypothetical protein